MNHERDGDRCMLCCMSILTNETDPPPSSPPLLI
jgi:hypothetical protein